ncbi:MAG: hypothetical protein V1865_02160 [bacterium]
MSLYTNVFKQSLKATFKNKYLWLFGFFATLFGGSIELDLLNGIMTKTNVFWQASKFTNAGLFGSEFFSNLKLSALTTDLLMVVFFFLCLIIAIIVVSVVSQVGIINNSANYIEKNDRTNIKVGIKAGMNHFWPIVVLNIITKVVVFLLLALAFMPLVRTGGTATAGSTALFIVLFVVVVIIVIALAFIIKYASGYIVVYAQRFREAVANGWILFKKNWLISTELGFMLFFINVFGSFAIILLIAVVAIPLAALTSFTMAFLSIKSFIIMYWIRFLISLMIFVVGGAILTTFNITAWTALFLRLNKGSGESKVMRIVSKF